MAVKVREGIDYKILPDDYRSVFNKKIKPVKRRKEIVNGEMQDVRYYRCMYCGHLIPHYEMDVDHIIPKTRLYAGILWNPNRAWNLGPSCKSCNISKSNYIDSRVIIGFRNKLLGRYGIGAGENAAYTSGDDDTQRWKVYSIMAIVGMLSVVAPVLIIVTKGAEYLLVYGAKILRWASKKVLFQIPKKIIITLTKIITSILKHPIKTVKRVMTTVALVILANVAMSYLGVTFTEAIDIVFKWIIGII